jgi:hypothetical protein
MGNQVNFRQACQKGQVPHKLLCRSYFIWTCFGTLTAVGLHPQRSSISRDTCGRGRTTFSISRDRAWLLHWDCREMVPGSTDELFPHSEFLYGHFNALYWSNSRNTSYNQLQLTDWDMASDNSSQIGVQLDSNRLIELINSMAEPSHKSDWTRIDGNTMRSCAFGTVSAGFKTLQCDLSWIPSTQGLSELSKPVPFFWVPSFLLTLGCPDFACLEAVHTAW